VWAAQGSSFACVASCRDVGLQRTGASHAILKQTLAGRPLALAVPRTQVAKASSRGNLSLNKLAVKEKAAVRMSEWAGQNAVCIPSPARSKAARSKAAPHLLAGFRCCCAAGREWRVRNAPR
jgi:hypothetical protein